MSKKRISILTISVIVVLTAYVILVHFSSVHAGIRVATYGGAEQVSGSLTCLQIDGKKYLIDCGAYYPDSEDGKLSYKEREAKANLENQQLPVKASDISTVFLTHAHIDHIGRLLLLERSGYLGHVYCSEGTSVIMRPMLIEVARYENVPRQWIFSKKSLNEKDYITVHWRNCQWAQKISPRNIVRFDGLRVDGEKKYNKSFSPCKICAKEEIQPLMQTIQTVCFDTKIQIEKGIYLTLLDAGHIPGASSLLFDISSNGGTKRLLFSGDLGNGLSPFQKLPNPAPSVDAVWVETTYGGTVRKVDSSEITQFISQVASAIDHNDIVWIPAFALERTQKILYLIAQAQQNGIIPSDVKIYCPSPTANEICQIYRNEISHVGSCQKWFKDEVYLQKKLFPNYERELPQQINRPSILITTSGMMDKVFSEKLLKDLVTKPFVHILIVGYQDSGSPGGMLKNGKDMLEWDNETFPVQAQVKSYSVFSAHADSNDVMKWLQNQPKSTRIFLVHGGSGQLVKQKKRLTEAGYTNVEISKKAFEYDL